jgi:hypothetical protein
LEVLLGVADVTGVRGVLATGLHGARGAGEGFNAFFSFLLSRLLFDTTTRIFPFNCFQYFISLFCYSLFAVMPLLA